MLLAACGGSAPTTLPADTLVRLSEAEIKTLDPQLFTELASARIAADQFVGLTRFDGQGRVVPALARDWSISRDGRVWRFTLRHGIRFSDGVPITPEVVKNS